MKIQNLLYKILGINLPTLEDIKRQATQQVLSESPNLPQKQSQDVAHVSFILTEDGAVHIDTDWTEDTSKIASVYAQLLYNLFTGIMEDNVLEYLYKYGQDNILSQEFIASVIGQVYELKQKYKNMPVISPSQVFTVPPTQK